MLTLHLIKVQTTLAVTCSSLLFALFTFLLVRLVMRTKLHKLVVVVVLMMLAQFFYSASCLMYYLMAAIVLEQRPSKKDFATLETVFFIMNFGLLVTFNVGSWLFVSNYWNFSKRLKLIIAEKDPLQEEKFVKRTTNFVLLLVVALCVFYLWANLGYVLGGGPRGLTVLAIVLLNMVQINCCVFLGISLYIIYYSIEKSKYRRLYQVDVKVIAWHSSGYLIQLLTGISADAAFYVSQEKFVKI